jgi:DNA-binding MarR family transcriptional regulator
MTKDLDIETAVTDLLLTIGQLTRRLRALPNSHELPWSQVAIMGRLEREGPMTTADLARAEVVKPQSMGGTLAAMEEEGFVERQPHPTDGRQVLFALTRAGMEIRKNVRASRHDWLMDAVERFTPVERKTFVASVELIRRLGASEMPD